ncbi:MAG TPA: adenylate/guanylate cyclase domain-containing protein [Planctomycetia bacterium]|nr:adenylate/guanylate cyclase domain-containing protein [Planctomycetia bacterium]
MPVLKVESPTGTLRMAFNAPMEIGRQREGEGPPGSLEAARDAKPQRWVIAHAGDTNIPRNYLVVEPLADGRTKVRNVSKGPCVVGNLFQAVAPGESTIVRPPSTWTVGRLTLTLLDKDDADADDYSVQTFSSRTIPPRFQPPAGGNLLNEVDRSQILPIKDWLETAVGVLQGALGAPDFLERAARAVVQSIEMDTGAVLLFEDGVWKTAASAGRPGLIPSSRLLDRMVAESKIVEHRGPEEGHSMEMGSLHAVSIAIAAPLLDVSGTVRGALYGTRETAFQSGRDVTEVESLLLGILASGVANGLVREEERGRQQRLSGFFGARLAAELLADPSLYERGREVSVTMLFADIRNFSAVSEDLGPEATVRWVRDVMDAMSDTVDANGGMVVDFAGDEMAAMWGAPRPSELADQCRQAVTAGMAVLEAVAMVNERWQVEIGRLTRVGIGINVGKAFVGDIGSKVKPKYGPIGKTVNTASRVQGITKYLNCPMLVTESVRDALGDSFIKRRVCKVKLSGMESAVDLFEVAPAGDQTRARLYAATDRAIEAYEVRDYAQAARTAGEALMEFRGDGPLLLALSRAAERARDDSGPFDPAWQPPGK